MIFTACSTDSTGRLFILKHFNRIHQQTSHTLADIVCSAAVANAVKKTEFKFSKLLFQSCLQNPVMTVTSYEKCFHVSPCWQDERTHSPAKYSHKFFRQTEKWKNELIAFMQIQYLVNVVLIYKKTSLIALDAG